MCRSKPKAKFFSCAENKPLRGSVKMKWLQAGREKKFFSADETRIGRAKNTK
jgi:hypothetical protein